MQQREPLSEEIGWVIEDGSTYRRPPLKISWRLNIAISAIASILAMFIGAHLRGSWAETPKLGALVFMIDVFWIYIVTLRTRIDEQLELAASTTANAGLRQIMIRDAWSDAKIFIVGMSALALADLIFLMDNVPFAPIQILGLCVLTLLVCVFSIVYVVRDMMGSA